MKLFRRLKIDNFDFNSMCRGIAEKTKGLSGREIAKLAVSWQVSSLIIIVITFNPNDVTIKAPGACFRVQQVNGREKRGVLGYEGAAGGESIMRQIPSDFYMYFQPATR